MGGFYALGESGAYVCPPLVAQGCPEIRQEFGENPRLEAFMGGSKLAALIFVYKQCKQRGDESPCPASLERRSGVGESLLMLFYMLVSTFTGDSSLHFGSPDVLAQE